MIMSWMDENCTVHKGDHDITEPDEASFGNVLQEKYAVFLERKKVYGNHLENAKRFPKEHESGLYIKCARMIRMFERGEELDRDTLIDMSNYCDIILSSKEE